MIAAVQTYHQLLPCQRWLAQDILQRVFLVLDKVGGQPQREGLFQGFWQVQGHSDSSAFEDRRGTHCDMMSINASRTSVLSTFGAEAAGGGDRAGDEWPASPCSSSAPAGSGWETTRGRFWSGEGRRGGSWDGRLRLFMGASAAAASGLGGGASCVDLVARVGMSDAVCKHSARWALTTVLPSAYLPLP